MGARLTFALAAFAALDACARRHATAARDASFTADTAVDPPRDHGPVANAAAAPAGQPEPAWCVQALPRVDARAVDRRGHVIALAAGALRDETAGGASVPLPRPAAPCATTHAHLAFAADGSAVAVTRGSVYVRADPSAPWVATPACTDVPGEPWSRRSDGPGWAVIARRLRGRELALLMTEDATGATGWYAITALDAASVGAVLEGDGSMLALAAGGHPVLIDRARHVAGAVLAAREQAFASLTRTAAGVVLARDDGEGARALVLGTTVQAPYAAQRRERPAGAHTRAVFVSDFGRMVAVTDRGVEWTRDDRAPFVEVARWPATDDAGADPTAGASLGWLANGSPVVTTNTAAVSRQCAVFSEREGTAEHD